MSTEGINNDVQDVKSKNLLWVWVRTFFFILVLSPVLLYFIVQVPSVQTLIKEKVAQIISSKTNTTVTLDKVNIGIFDGFSIKGLSIAESAKDSLLTIGSFNLSLRKNLLFFLKNDFDISEISLVNVNLNIRTKFGETKSNLATFIENLSSKNPSNKKTNSNIFLSIDKIHLNDISVGIDNENKGVYIHTTLKSGLIDIKRIDLDCNELTLDKLILVHPDFKQSIYNENRPIKGDQNFEPNSNIFEELSLGINFSTDYLEIKDGVLGVHNQLIPINSEDADLLDFNHFEFSDINLNVYELNLNEQDELFLILNKLNLKTDKGFILKNLSIDTVSVNSSGSQLSNFSIETNKSKLNSDISMSYLGYESFRNLMNEIIFNIDVNEAELDLTDISHFIKGMRTAPILKGFLNEKINLKGIYYGKLTSLGGKDVEISVGNKLSIVGSFNTRNLNDYDNTVLNIKLDKFSSSMSNIKKLIPSFNPPQNFYKLGNITFKGRFDGYLEDFVAYGKLNSGLGVAELDMRLDITKGGEKASYSGELNLFNFNLGYWSGNSDVGFVNFNSKVNSGKGLTLKTLQSDFSATVKSIEFKKYSYKNFTINGIFENNTFAGLFVIVDPNIDVVFDGSVEYLNQIAFLNFKSKVKNLDLYALNLSKSPLSLSGEIDINTSGNSINEILGQIDIKNLAINSKDSLYELSEILLQSKTIATGGKELSLFSDLGTILIKGDYDIPNVANSVLQILKSNYPSLTNNLKNINVSKNVRQYIDFDLRLNDSKNFGGLLGLPSFSFNKLDLKGRIDTYKNEISIASTSPLIKLDNNSLKNFQLLVSSDLKRGDILLHIDSTYAFGKKFNPIDFQSQSYGDSIAFNLVTTKLIDSIENLDIKGYMVPHTKGFKFSLTDNKIEMLDKVWHLKPKNSIVYGTNYLEISNFELSDGFRSLELFDIDNKGIKGIVKNFDIDLINPFVNYKEMLFGGLTIITLEAFDIFSSDITIGGSISIPTFNINKDPYGSLNLIFEKYERNLLDIDVNIGDFITGGGHYNLDTKSLESKIRIKQANLRLLEYMLHQGIDNTKGFLDADIILSGPIKDLKMTGNGTVNKGQTRLIYTGVTYEFDKQKFLISETEIDLNGVVIQDVLKNKASVSGVLTHKMFKDFGIKATIISPNIIGLNTTIADNPDYYGYAVGSVRVDFSGLFKNMDMVINAQTNLGTKLFIPVGSTQLNSQENFIKFEKRTVGKIEEKDRKLIQGLDLEVNLGMTPDAEVSIIFDEAKGDIIRGVGRGNLQMFIKRNGNFDIFGDYEIERGDYLFTVALLPVAKPFAVKRGGLIRWTGDPVNTSLNIEAVYRSRTIIRPFIEEYMTFASDQAINQANQRQEVDLILNLGGTLYNPDVRFNLSFPNLVGDLSTLTESKLRVLQNNELELNSQVFGLIMFNAFLPSNRISDVLGVGGLQSVGLNTLSEFLSSQLSMYITSLLHLAFVERGYSAGVDFELGLRNNTNTVGALDNRNILPDEIEFRLKNRFKFLDERMSFNFGGNYVIENQLGAAVNQILPDVSLELIITKDRKLKARIYSRTDINLVTQNASGQNENIQKFGLGLSFRTEFGSMLDYEKGVKIGLDKILQN